MSRFSPTVLPTAPVGLGTALAEGFNDYMDERKKKQLLDLQKQQATDTHTAAAQSYVREGGRYGTAPSDPGTDITVKDTTGDYVPRGTSPAEMAAALRGTAPTASSAPFSVNTAALNQAGPTQPYDVDPKLVAGMLKQAPTSAAAPDAGVEPVAPTNEQGEPVPQGMTYQGGAAHPGGFDPNSLTFGGTEARAVAEARALAPPPVTTHLAGTGRYVQTDPTHFQDTEGSESARLRLAQQQMTAALLGQRLGVQEDIADKKTTSAEKIAGGHDDTRRDVAGSNNAARLTLADVNNADRDKRQGLANDYKQQQIELAGKVRDQVEAHIAGIKSTNAAGKPLTPNQQVNAQRYVFDQIGKQSGGDPDEAASILKSDGALAATAKSLGIGEAEVRRAATAFGAKADAASEKEILSIVGPGGSAADVAGAAGAVKAAKGAATTAKPPAPGSPPSGSTTASGASAASSPDALKASQAWKKANPRGKDETGPQYYQRYLAGTTTPPA